MELPSILYNARQGGITPLDIHLFETRRLNLREIVLQPVAASEEERFQALMEAHHYLGALPKIGHTLWYVANWNGQWLALLSFSAAAWKCAARDAWIGWDFRHQYDRLHLVANNSRFLILPEHHVPNLASHVLALSERRTMCNAIDAEGRQVHILGVVGHQSQTCHTQKKSAPCP